MIDLTFLVNALKSLARATDRSLTSPGDEEVRDAVIQRFEYCYELSWKMLKRKLKLDAATPQDIDRMSFKDLIREWAAQGLFSWIDNSLLRGTGIVTVYAEPPLFSFSI